MPKWEKVILWIFGILAGLILVVGIGLKIWISTWSEYKGNDFSVKYPTGWYVDTSVLQAPEQIQIITPPPRVTKNSVDFINRIFTVYFYGFEKKNLETFSAVNTKELIASAVKLKDGVYLKLYYPTLADLLIIKGDKVFYMSSDVEVANTGKNMFKETTYWLTGLLIFSTLSY